ncbi:hypothetical protein ACSFA2_16665 [Variovorax sp. LT2P21]
MNAVDSAYSNAVRSAAHIAFQQADEMLRHEQARQERLERPTNDVP